MRFWARSNNGTHEMMHLCHLRHKRQTLSDFQNDCHRFSLWFNGNETEVQCYGRVDVFFDDKENIPDTVQYEVLKKIYELIDEREFKWAVPKSAQEIANEYCVENFFY